MAKKSSPSGQAKNRPEKKIGPYAGGISIVIWRNHIETDEGPREIRSLSIAPRRYRDKESGEWRDAGSFRPSDIPALMHGLAKALDYLYSTPLSREPGEDDGQGDTPY